MIYRMETVFRAVRHMFSRDRFFVWLFGMSKTASETPERGIIMLQIDGLSRPELQHAIANGYMPFTKSLLEKEHYKLHSLYAGAPSCTPAAHGELFYGVKGCVPAFRFKRPEDKYTMAMLEPTLAKGIQERLEKLKISEPLMKGGSVFSDMFDGGADEASFCAASMGWSSLIPSKNIYKMTIFMLLNIVSLIKVIFLTCVELFLAIIDIFRGVLAGQNILEEVKFVPVRIATAVLLREFVTIGINLDSSRGLPIIHGNYLSYDEQSHRRGPNSRFAHWSLKGIDKSICRVWKAAKRSKYREYDIWVHSDHGQEKTRSYDNEFGESIHSAVNRVLLSYVKVTNSINQSAEKEIVDDPNLQRLRLLGNKRLNKWLLRRRPTEKEDIYIEFSLAAMGPLGFIYLDQPLEDNLRRALAIDLVRKAHIPMVLTALENDETDLEISVWTEAGELHLPEHKDMVFGKDHPFLDDICADFIKLCHHEYAGNFILSGWTPFTEPMSLRIENGAHAGPGKNETHAFALLPEDLPLNTIDREYIRFLDLFHAAKQQMHAFEQQHSNEPTPSVSSFQSLTMHRFKEKKETKYPQKSSFRMMTYNVHNCLGMDGRMSPKRIARVIAMYQPDAIALQELNSSGAGSKYVDQVKSIADELGMNIEFLPVKKIPRGFFGNAILSKHPINLRDSRQLASKPKRFRLKIAPLTQARGVIEVEVDFYGHTLSIMNTHLGLTTKDRRAQVLDILNSPSFGQNKSPTIFCGDFNASPRQYVHHLVSKVMPDVEDQMGRGVFKKTFPTRYPVVRLDHIFVDRRVQVKDVFIPANHLTKVASDHLPVIADLDLSELLKGQAAKKVR